MLDAKEKAQEAAKVVKELVEELQAAAEADASARCRESEAGNHACDCRNRLNTAQKKMDAWYAEQRRGAPHDSDWGRKRKEKAVTQ